jgi:long-chain acyl-CoA synthetase
MHIDRIWLPGTGPESDVKDGRSTIQEETTMNRPWLKHYDQGVPQTLTYPSVTLGEMLIASSKDYADHIATTLNDVDITYREINEKVNAFAHLLHELGVGKGDRVAMVLPNSPTYVIAFYGAMKIGAVAVNINVMSHGSELTRFLTDAAAKVVVTLDLFLKNVADAAGGTSVSTVVVHSVFGQEKTVRMPEGVLCLVMAEATAGRPITEPKLDVDPDDIAVLQYTSGSTGRPKAAILTHRTIMANVIQINSWDTYPKADNPAVICIIPFFHVFGMTICLHLSVYKGYRMILYPMFDWSSIIDFLSAVKKYRPVSFPAVPALWAALVSHPDAEQYELSCIEVGSGGGAPLPLWVQEKYLQLTGKRIAQAYGLSEVSSASHLNPFRSGKLSDSIGLPLPDTEVKIVDVDTGTKECPVGEVGEMIIRGPQVMKGYWQDPERTRSALRDGWLYTGDLARMDADGYFYLIDRKDDLMIVSGFNVYPSDVEAVLKTHPQVKDVVVVGAPDKIRGEIIVAYVVAADPKELNKRALIEHCRTHLPDYKIPRVVHFIDEIPKNKVGKPLRIALKDPGKTGC